ncbi:glycosyltransferase family 2 protein [Vibrio furnissii]
MLDIQKPLVSVVMPVYNSELYLEKAIESVLSQSYSNFELLIIDDGSTDNSISIVNSFKDKRIKLYSNGQNKGLIYTLNYAINLCRGEFVARMDADDICLADRFLKQINYLQKNTDVGLCGMHAFPIGNVSLKSRIFNIITDSFSPPTFNDDILISHIFECRIIHPTVMIRKSIFDSGFRYDMEAIHAEDYDLWVRISSKFKLGNIPDLGVNYRIHNDSVSHKYKEQQILKSLPSRKKAAHIALDIPMDDPFFKIFDNLFLDKSVTFSSFEINTNLFFGYLSGVNQRVIKYYFWRHCCRNSNFGFKTLSYYLKSDFSYSPLSLKSLILICLVSLRKAI